MDGWFIAKEKILCYGYDAKKCREPCWKNHGAFFTSSARGSGFHPFTAALFGGRDGKVDVMDCFAMKDGKCSVMKCGKCGGGTCHFHKTREEQAQSLEKVSERLRSLPEYQQEAIADKYYGGVRKW